MRSFRRSLLGLSAILCFAALQMIPAAINGFPFVFFDTRGYYASGAAVAGFIAGDNRTESRSGTEMLMPADAGAMRTQSGQAGEAAVDVAPVPANDPVVDGEDGAPREPVDTTSPSFARSPYYGFPLYLFVSVGPFVVAAMQAIAIAAVAWLTVRTVVPKRPVVAFLAAGVVCAAATPLPFFAAYLIPDIFSAVIPLGFFLLAWGWNGLSVLERVLLWLLLAASLVFHTTHLLLMAGLVVFTALLALWPALRPSWRGWTAATAAFGAGILGVVIFTVAVRAVFGVDPVNPPYLTARGLEDGPVLAMIEAACDGHNFAVCQADPVVNADSQAFLWGPVGYYFDANTATRKRLSEEDFDVFFAAALEHPLWQLGASVRNSVHQALMFGLYDFGTAPEVLVRSAPAWMPPDVLRQFAASAVAEGRLPLGLLSSVVYAVTALAAIVLARLALTRRISAVGSALLLLVLAVLVGNAILGGALSDAHHRYQARLIWLLPFLAVVLTAASLTMPAGRRS